MRAPLSLLFLLSAVGGPLEAQTGLLVVAHGAGPEWNARVRETVSQVRWTRGPVAVAFLMGPESEQAGWSRGVEGLVASGATEIVAVPLMVSSHGAHVRQMEYYAGLRATIPAGLEPHVGHEGQVPPPVPMRVTGALDAAPELGVAIAERWRSLEPRDRARPVMLVAHGPSDNEEARAWISDLTSVARVLPLAGLTQPVEVSLLKDDAAPEVRAQAVEDMRRRIRTLAGQARDSVVVLPILISSGPILDTKIPADLAGTPIRYVRIPLAPRPELARWIERMAESVPAGVSLSQ